MNAVSTLLRSHLPVSALALQLLWVWVPLLQSCPWLSIDSPTSNPPGKTWGCQRCHLIGVLPFLNSTALYCIRLKLVSSWDHITAKHLPLPILFPTQPFSPQHPHHNHVTSSPFAGSAPREPKLRPGFVIFPSLPLFLSNASFIEDRNKKQRHEDTEPQFHWLHNFTSDLGQGLLYFCIISAFA